MSLIKEYFELTKKYQSEYGTNTILLMQVGAFFEVYGYLDSANESFVGSNIQSFSQICELNVVAKNTCVGENDVYMAGFKDFMIEKYLKKIQDAGFTAVVYVQDENVKGTTRSLGGIFSPGTYFHTETPQLSNSITCIWIHYSENQLFVKGKFVIVGIANIDIFTGKTSLFQFKEIYMNNPTTYDELERFISIYNPSEVILISNLPSEKETNNVLSFAGINSKLVHKIHLESNASSDISDAKMTRIKNCEKQTYQKEILAKFYNFDNYEIFIQNFYENNIAAQSFCYLLDFVYQHNPYLVNKISEPIFENSSKRLVLANHSLKQLHILDDGTVNSSKYSCVSNLLNNCSTPMGRRQFLYNILNPIYDCHLLEQEYSIIEYYLTKLDVFDSLFKRKLQNIKDIAKFERQMHIKKMSPKMFYTLFNNIEIIRDICQNILTDSTLEDYFGRHVEINQIIPFCDELSEFINNNINLSVAKDIDQLQDFDKNFICPTVDENLDKKNYTLKESQSKLESIREYLSNLIEKGEKKSSKTKDYIKIHETGDGIGLVSTSRRTKLLAEYLPKDLAITNLSCIIDNQVKHFDFVIAKNKFEYSKQSASNNYVEHDDINSLCRCIISTKSSMKELISLVFNKFVENFCKFQSKLDMLIKFITLVDVLHTKADLAKKYNYCRPLIADTCDKSFVEAKGLRHCLTERLQSSELYVTNDIKLGDGCVDGILLFGTNAVGKTTLIRALGVAVIMAQSGMFVPCSNFTFYPYRQIFTRIIGNDNIFKGLSTFEVEMSELRTIFRLMDKNSLILGDELCSGTETVSAISIFVAGIQRMTKANSSFIFATHLHEIVNYDEITSLASVHLKHLEVKYDKEHDMLVYDRKLKDGSGSNIYGLEVCKSLGLPADFLEDAFNIRVKYNPDTGSILSLKTSRYNANKIVNMCEKCGNSIGKEVHHLQHQSDANENGLIVNADASFHKNNLANLMTLCEKCHNEIHKEGKKLKRIKTTKGTKLQTVDEKGK